MSIFQDQMNRFFEIIANSKLNSELAEASAISSEDMVFSVQQGTNDALKAAPSLVRGHLGTYNATTNTPTLSNGTGVNGDSYLVTVAGTQNFGAGAVSLVVDNVIEYREGKWRNRNLDSSKDWYWIEGSDVRKTGGSNIALLETGDTVRFKAITNNGFPVTIPYGVYGTGDKEDADNYTLPTLLT